MDTSTKALSIHFTNLDLPLEAQDFLLLVWEIFQSLDDWRDEEKLSAEEIEEAIYKVLGVLPRHAFFVTHHADLSSALSVAVLKWFAANQMEDAKEVTETSFVWRAGYYDIVLLVVNLVHGYKNARKASAYVAKMYGEEYKDYVEEFK